MATTTRILFLGLFLWLGRVALLGVLEHFLSRTESPWPGRVLPILSWLGAAGSLGVVLMNVLAPMFHHGTTILMAGTANYLGIVLFGLSALVPPILYTVIYCLTRRKYRARKDVEKMTIHDL